MQRFTKFGIWEKEIQEFICHVCAEQQISKDALETWFYSEGIMIFVLAQTQSYNQYEALFKEQYQMLPCNISGTMMSGYKMDGFKALLAAMVSKFAQSNPVLHSQFNHHFNLFLYAIKIHESFYEIQAEIRNALNEFLNLNPEISAAAKMKFIIDQYAKQKIMKPDHSDQMSDDLVLVTEFLKAVQLQAAVH